MSNVETNGKTASVIKGLSDVVITNPETVSEAKKKQSKKTAAKPKLQTVESASIQEIFVDKYNCILRYEGSKVFIMQSIGDAQRLLGEMTVKGLSRNVSLHANTQILDLIAIANRKFSPVSKVEMEAKKIQKMNEARAAIASLF